MDTGENVVSMAEEDGSGSDTTHVTGDDVLSGMEDATVTTLGGGVVEEDGTSGVTAGSGRSGKMNIGGMEVPEAFTAQASQFLTNYQASRSVEHFNMPRSYRNSSEIELSRPLVLISGRVTFWKHLWVLRQTGSHFLLLLKPPRVRNLDLAPFAARCFIHDPLQSGVQLRVLHHVLWVGASSGGWAGPMLTAGGVGNKLCRDFIQNLGLGFFSPQE
ncbi:hypothetical protein FQN60_004417, partial [Etheostoma spectabile]